MYNEDVAGLRDGRQGVAQVYARSIRAGLTQPEIVPMLRPYPPRTRVRLNASRNAWPTCSIAFLPWSRTWALAMNP